VNRVIIGLKELMILILVVTRHREVVDLTGLDALKLGRTNSTRARVLFEMLDMLLDMQLDIFLSVLLDPSSILVILLLTG
jgi:hypothetical protein